MATMGEYASMVYGERWMPATENEEGAPPLEKKGVQRLFHAKGILTIKSSLNSSSSIA